MTLEGHEPGAEDTPAPPASTRWSEAPAEDDDVLLPPYVPGGRRPAPAESSSSAAEGDLATSWADLEGPDPGTPAAGADDHGDVPAPSGDAGQEAAVESGADPEGQEPTGFPWDAGDAEGAAGLPEMEAVAGWGAAPDAADGGVADATAEVDERGEDADGGRGAGGLPGMAEPLPEADPLVPAERLEMLAEILRREGPAGIHREVASRDRLTSLLAGVVAGYLAGLEG